MRRPKSKLEEEFERQVIRFRLPLPQREFRFATSVNRQHRFDFAWPDLKLAVECDGFKVESVRLASGRYQRVITTGHGTPTQMHLDADKRNMAVMLGWWVLVFHETAIENGDAIAVTQRVLAVRTTS